MTILLDKWTICRKNKREVVNILYIKDKETTFCKIRNILGITTVQNLTHQTSKERNYQKKMPVRT